MELRVRNVNGALRAGLQLFRVPGAVARKVRGSKTLEWYDPVITIYQKPCERVLFCPERDANPFFHLFEAVWMLAGRDDVRFISHIVKHMATFSDNGMDLNGAYGFRWRQKFGYDQLKELAILLRQDPFTRRAVLQMWHTDDLRNAKSRDVPCNTNIYFKVRDDALDMTVCCRSNDMIWGAYGANAVHFSVLLEYMADKIGRPVGRMIQVSDSFHVYTEGGSAAVWNKVKDLETMRDFYMDGAEIYPLGAGGASWDEDLQEFFYGFDNGGGRFRFRTKWWKNVLEPMWKAWLMRDPHELDLCEAEDWAEAGRAWLSRHVGKAGA